MANSTKQSRIQHRKRRTRAKIAGTAARPRVSVSASLRGMYVQLVDDVAGATLISGSDAAFSGTKTERAALLGKQIAQAAIAAGIGQATFDRGSKQYHGRIQAFADALREGGITV